MTSHNNGRSYEQFVANIYNAMYLLENKYNMSNINIETNKKIIDKNGIEREFDIYWEFSCVGITYKTVIECKDYANKISIEKIDAFLGKTIDIPGLRLIYATKTGYQSGAATKAKNNNIDLLIITEPNNTINGDANSVKLTVKFDIIGLSSPEITKINIYTTNNRDKLLIDHIHENFNKNQIFIKDADKGQRYSLLDLQKQLTNKMNNISDGENQYSEEFTNAYYEDIDASISIKFKKYDLTFIQNPPTVTKMERSVYRELLGIIENYITKEKEHILKPNSSNK